MTLPPFPTFNIYIEDTVLKFVQFINDTMQGEVMFHFSVPTSGI
jgi:hypothetical protein